VLSQSPYYQADRIRLPCCWNMGPEARRAPTALFFGILQHFKVRPSSSSTRAPDGARNRAPARQLRAEPRLVRSLAAAEAREQLAAPAAAWHTPAQDGPAVPCVICPS
jgi:hypothetical protein